MDIILEFAKLLIPAGAVLYGMFLVVKSFIQKELDKATVEVRAKNTEVVLPLRLQAYERICLFLERIAPNNLVIRVRDNSFNAGQFHHALIHEIREEYNHNLSQQIYISNNAWNLVKNAKEEIITVVNQAAEGLAADAKSLDLAKRIFEKMLDKPADPSVVALSQIKEEVRSLY
jgi:DNA-binding Xre family transcriptional regulator